MVCVRRLVGALTLSALMVFTGCVGKDKKASSEEPILSEVDGDGVQRPAIERIPNPYLALDSKVSKEAEKAFDAAIVSIQSEDWSTAEQQLTSMTQAYPELSGPWVNLGLVLRHQKKWPEAQQAFDQALVVNPLNNDAYVQYAVMLRERGQFKEAEALYLKAIQVWPHNREAIVNLGILYDMYMGRFDDALTQFELAQQISEQPDQELEGWIIDLKRRQSE